MLKSTLRLATTAVLLLASIGASAQPATTKPLEIAGVYQEQVGPAARCASKFGGTIAGHGQSALLGRVAFIATDCITPQPPLFNFSEGRFVVVTASGDQIFATYSGQFVPTGVGANYVFSGATFQITGGNGQYAKASGGGALNGTQDMATGMGTLKLTGQIRHAEGKEFTERQLNRFN
ncbi:hypothetical protein CR105_00540 [Massilia eurypsychrophila]|jgi:hypothetical protein|uniref:DUF3224 domain-containing protein n=1 Tax=Massilia eurypsychrophila TaxID=1485217 RepID=A0A2G8TKW0_9BURK|nr:hypothetical protein [Massilia eurypsychrophila]PIL46681.1 hypothetical protein CR105_00540 [Massilia eurypsychrophila]